VHTAQAQSTAAINAGAVSTNSLIYSVGDIYVLPVAPNQASSGLVGAVSRIDFYVTGIDDILTPADVQVYPNPTNHSVYITTTAPQPVQQVDIYDMNGRLVLNQTRVDKGVDLSALSDGTYFIKTDTDKNKTFKITKQ
jgi:hypothetical protein